YSASLTLLMLETADAGLANPVVRRHLEERQLRFVAIDRSEPIARVTIARILVLRQHEDVQIRRRPLLHRDDDLAFVADSARGDRRRRSFAVGEDAFDDF